MNFSDWVGSIGVGLLLLAFVLNLLNKIPKNGITYFLINFIGSGLATVASYLIHYVPFIILEFAWMLTSAYGMWKAYEFKKGTP
ncbi:MAG: hypothetical protein ABI691_21935 [Ginsengibacter sp.]